MTMMILMLMMVKIMTVMIVPRMITARKETSAAGDAVGSIYGSVILQTKSSSNATKSAPVGASQRLPPESAWSGSASSGNAFVLSF